MSYDVWGVRRDPVNWFPSIANNEPVITNLGFTGHEHLDKFSLINMNGRVYDPVIARFISPDPIIQTTAFAQGLNCYAYCMNNPLSLVDPSGYSWLSENWKPLVSSIVAITVAAVATVATSGAALGVAIFAGTLGGMAGGVTSAILNGGSFNDVMAAGLVGAALGGLTSIGAGLIGGAFVGPSISFLREVGRAVAHGMFNGGMRILQGGKFLHGFLSGSFSSLVGSAVGGAKLSFAGSTAVGAAIGGTAEALGGGKFANGAVTGAYTVLFNHTAHSVAAKIDVAKFKDKYFSQVKGLNKLYTNETPDGYTDADNGLFLNADGIEVGAVTVYVGDGKSDVYLSSFVQKDAFELYVALGHEMIHVAHRNKFLNSYSKSPSEYYAYKWSYNVYENLWPGKGGQYKKAMNSYKPIGAYDYDKFGFSSTPPPSLWDW